MADLNKSQDIRSIDTEKQQSINLNISDGVLSDGRVVDHGHIISNDHVVDPEDPGELRVLEIRQKFSALRSLRDWEQWLDAKMGVEGQGVERIPEDKRVPPSRLNMIFIWFSNLMTPGGIPVGILGPEFGLSLSTSLILTIFATILGSAFPAFTATFSSATGLRQIAVSRYAFGIQGAKLCGLLNIIVNIGFGVVNSIVSGQLLRAVSGDTLPLEIGIVIIAVLGTVISVFGFRIIHTYERYAWILIFVLLLTHWGEAGHLFKLTRNEAHGLDYTGDCLSYFAIVFGSCTGSRVSDAYEDGGSGALILATLHPSGFGKFVCVMYSLSFLGNIIPIIYSSALSVQLWGRHFHAIPRFIWCTVLGVIMLVLGLSGRNVLETILSNFLSLLGYWTIAYTVIMFEEHFLFRKLVLKAGYDLHGWQDQKKMPLGHAGTGALIAGFGVAFVGMNQTWYVGPVAKKIGAYGGDVGDYFSFVVSLVMYPVFRWLEIKFTGR
ncbi:putative ncs family nucleoside [Phaeomoniella chlamydospora]|uniref:Putative ncs family nucleoside n=1 Tax=Phaeomoniella chlamydospora TaxID=158046 RepID=A0A0G2E543_PHACM|nr:putative ncs family nucleoside [Phaeomoniella chlamydospora]